MAERITRRKFLGLALASGAAVIASGLPDVFAQTQEPDLSATEVDFDPNFVYRGPMRVNNIGAFAQDSTQLFEAGINQWIAESYDQLGSRVTDYAYRSITDSWTEQGLGHSSENMANYKVTLNTLNIQGTPLVNTLVSPNGELSTFGFYGPEHDSCPNSNLPRYNSWRYSV